MALVNESVSQSHASSRPAVHQQRVLLVANTSWYLYNFRLPLIRDLRRQGYQVALVAPHDAHTPLQLAEGFCVHNWLVARSSVNPLSEAHALVDLLRIYRRERPDLVHHFTIKACLYGTIAAKGARVYRVINAVTGLGHVFLGTRNAAACYVVRLSLSTRLPSRPAAPRWCSRMLRIRSTSSSWASPTVNAPS